MTDFNDSKAFITALEDLVTSRHRPVAGALFRAAFLIGETSSPQFLTGCCLFEEVPHHGRPPQNYGGLIMTEEWIPDPNAGIAALARLTDGKGKIAGVSVSRSFTQSRLTRKLDGAMWGWGGWEFSSRAVRNSGEQEVYLDQETMIAFGLPPRAGAAEGIAQWVFDVESTLLTSYGGKAPQYDQIITQIPDTRGRIFRAQWSPGIVSAEIELGTNAEAVEVQVLFRGARDSYAATRPAKSDRWEVPDGTREITLFLVHESGDSITRVRLRSEYDFYGKGTEEAGMVSRAEQDLRDGENDHVEFKPWISPKNPKEGELVETIIAFANTGGGRLYVGVDDRGTPLGDIALCKALEVNPETSIERQVERLHTLRREKIKPVPPLRVERLEVFGERILLVEIERGHGRPYSTISNNAFIRKGATNRIADPRTEMPRADSLQLGVGDWTGEW